MAIDKDYSDKNCKRNKEKEFDDKKGPKRG
jgi:hypothetical protein